MTLITYQRRAVAMAGPDGVYLAPHVAHRPDDDPLKRFVGLLILHARDAQAGRLPGEPGRYLPGRAERYVRERLMPQPTFRAHETLDDRQLAEIFDVPLEQVRERRRDLTEPTAAPQPGALRRRRGRRRGCCQVSGGRGATRP